MCSRSERRRRRTGEVKSVAEMAKETDFCSGSDFNFDVWMYHQNYGHAETLNDLPVD